MLRSMTGYATYEKTYENFSLEITIKSLNSRFFDCRVKTDNNTLFLDPIIRKALKDKFFRGTFEVFIKLTNNAQKDKSLTTAKQIDSCYSQLEKIKLQYNINEAITLNSIIQSMKVFDYDNVEEFNNSDVEKAFKEVSEVVFEHLIKSKEEEGKILKKDICDCVKNALKYLDDIIKKYPVILEHYKNSLNLKIQELLNEQSVNEERVLTEVAILAEKNNINEETVRLKNHLENILSLSEMNSPIGKKIDFTLQEANREINTIGSKVSDVDISKFVIEIKSEIEKIREQVQNIE